MKRRIKPKDKDTNTEMQITHYILCRNYSGTRAFGRMHVPCLHTTLTAKDETTKTCQLRKPCKPANSVVIGQCVLQ